MKPDKLLCYIFLFPFVALTLHKQQYNLECVGATDQSKRFIFNCGVNVKTKDCAGLRPFQHKLQHHCFHGKVSKPVHQVTMATLKSSKLQSQMNSNETTVMRKKNRNKRVTSV